MMCVEPVITVFEPSTASRQTCAPSTTMQREPMKQLSSMITGAALIARYWLEAFDKIL